MEDKVYVIECRTGCSCCANENHHRGVYLTRAEAQARIDRFKRGVDNPVASQYSKYGNYNIEEYSAELLPGGRVIVGHSRVVDADDIVSVNLLDGSVTVNDYLVI